VAAIFKQPQYLKHFHRCDGPRNNIYVYIIQCVKRHF